MRYLREVFGYLESNLVSIGHNTRTRQEFLLTGSLFPTGERIVGAAST
jgi:hypothetical protein